MPRGRPRKYPEVVSADTSTLPGDTDPQAATGTTPVSKTDAVIHALKTLGLEAKPKAIQEYVATKFGVEMPTSLISNYKSTLSKRITGESRLVRNPVQSAAPASVRVRTPGSISLADLEAIKALAERIGAAQVAAVAELLA